MSREDRDALLNPVFEFALKMLAEQGEFYPFGAVLTREGKVRLVAGTVGAVRPRASQVIAVLEEGLRAEILREEHRAAGLCLGVRVSHPRLGKNIDAVLARIEEADGEAARVYLPYERGEGGALRTAPPVGEKASPRLFPPGVNPNQPG